MQSLNVLGLGLPFAVAVLGLALLTDCGTGGEAADGGDAGGADALPDRGRPPINRPSDGEEIPPSTTEGGGRRFRPVYFAYRFEDGARLRTYAGYFHDLSSETDCMLRPLHDGQWGCVPLAYDVLRDGFADAACTTPVSYFDRAAHPSNVALAFGSCASKVYRYPEFDAGRPVYAKRPDGSCYLSDAAKDVLTSTTPVSSAELGGFELSHEGASLSGERDGSRVASFVTRWTGTDGSFATDAPRFGERATSFPGRFLPTLDGTVRFLPAERIVSASLGFADATCTEPVLHWGQDPVVGCGSAMTPSPDALQFADDRRGQRCRAVRVVGPPADPTPVRTYIRSGDECREVPSDASYRPAQFTEVPLDRFVSATRSLVKDSRLAVQGPLVELRAWRHEASDGFAATERVARPYLTKFGVACAVSASGFQQWRCYPQSPVGRTVFADAACSERLVSLDSSEWSCEERARLYLQFGDDGARHYFRHAAGPALRPTTLFEKSMDSCLPIDVQQGDEYYADPSPEPIAETDFPLVEPDVVFDDITP